MQQKNQNTNKYNPIAHRLLPIACFRARANSSTGLTLVETVVWVAIFALIIPAIAASVLYFYRTNKYALEQSSAVTSAQRGMDKMVRTIREAAYGSDGAFPIVSIGANDLVFYADTDSDPLIEKVHYFLSGTDLSQGIVDPAGDPPSYGGAEAVSTLSDYVRNQGQTATFNYYDKDGAEITDYSNRTAVRFVKMSVIVNVDPNRLPNQLTLSSSAALRNLK